MLDTPFLGTPFLELKRMKPSRWDPEDGHAHGSPARPARLFLSDPIAAGTGEPAGTVPRLSRIAAHYLLYHYCFQGCINFRQSSVSLWQLKCNF